MLLLNNLRLVFDIYFSVDATFTTRIGRYVNDAQSASANCTMKVLLDENEAPHLCLFNKDHIIPAGVELDYYYGLTEPSMYWRKVSK
jgi:hypothetical protein